MHGKNTISLNVYKFKHPYLFPFLCFFYIGCSVSNEENYENQHLGRSVNFNTKTGRQSASNEFCSNDVDDILVVSGHSGYGKDWYDATEALNKFDELDKKISYLQELVKSHLELIERYPDLNCKTYFAGDLLPLTVEKIEEEVASHNEKINTLEKDRQDLYQRYEKYSSVNFNTKTDISILKELRPSLEPEVTDGKDEVTDEEDEVAGGEGEVVDGESEVAGEDEQLRQSLELESANKEDGKSNLFSQCLKPFYDAHADAYLSNFYTSHALLNVCSKCEL